MSKKCINPNELTAYLNKVVTNSQQKPSDRDKLALDKPYIHSKAIPFDEEGEIDVDEFIKKITAMPNDILSVNAKMAKSSDDNSISVNIGIPPESVSIISICSSFINSFRPPLGKLSI